MANTGTAEKRHRILDSLFRQGFYSTQELMDAVNRRLTKEEQISALNTIRNDKDYMEDHYPVKIKKLQDGHSIKYGYDDPDMSIHKLQFNDDEMSQLQQCMAILSRFSGMPNMKWMDNFLERFKYSLNIDTNLGYVVGFDTCKNLEGQHHFNRLLTAITHHQVLNLKYKSFKVDEPQEIIVYPYFVQEFNKRWFLLARRKGRDNISNFAFDRIISIDIVTNEPFVTEDDIDFQREYFKDVIGVTRKEAPLEKIKLWVSKETAPYVLTKPIHVSQDTEKNEDGSIKVNKDGSMIIEIEVIPNYELEQALLYYGEGVKVLSPQSIVDKMKAHAERMAEAYNPDKTANE